jgi:hypothetical protein
VFFRVRLLTAREDSATTTTGFLLVFFVALLPVVSHRVASDASSSSARLDVDGSSSAFSTTDRPPLRFALRVARRRAEYDDDVVVFTRRVLVAMLF